MESFVFYQSFWEAVRRLPEETGNALLRAIIEYGIEQNEYSGDDFVVAAMMAALTPQMEAAKAKRIKTKGGQPGNKNACRRNRGAISGTNENESQTNDETNKRIETNTPYNVNVNVNVDGNVNNDSSSEDSESSSAVTTDADFGRSVRAKTDLAKAAAEVVRYYNARVAETGSSLPSSVSPPPEHRRQAVAARLREYGEEAVRRVVDNAVGSQFLNSRRFGIDWIMGPRNFPKVLEGNYDGTRVEVQGRDAPVSFRDRERERQRQAAIEADARYEEGRQYWKNFEQEKQGVKDAV